MVALAHRRLGNVPASVARTAEQAQRGWAFGWRDILIFERIGNQAAGGNNAAVR